MLNRLYFSMHVFPFDFLLFSPLLSSILLAIFSSVCHNSELSYQLSHARFEAMCPCQGQGPVTQKGVSKLCRVKRVFVQEWKTLTRNMLGQAEQDIHASGGKSPMVGFQAKEECFPSMGDRSQQHDLLYFPNDGTQRRGPRNFCS